MSYLYVLVFPWFFALSIRAFMCVCVFAGLLFPCRIHSLPKWCYSQTLRSPLQCSSTCDVLGELMSVYNANINASRYFRAAAATTHKGNWLHFTEIPWRIKSLLLLFSFGLCYSNFANDEKSCCYSFSFYHVDGSCCSCVHAALLIYGVSTFSSRISSCQGTIRKAHAPKLPQIKNVFSSLINVDYRKRIAK